jgi:periplasmic protein CpxP/Spy
MPMKSFTTKGPEAPSQRLVWTKSPARRAAGRIFHFVGESAWRSGSPILEESPMKVIVAMLISMVVFGAVLAQASADAKRDAAVEQRIMELHAQLKITPSEEAQWTQVAVTMRENARDLDRVIDKRDATVANATAIDNLYSYADIAQAHANGVRKLAGAFSALYAVMSESQRKLADVVFNHRDYEAGKVASR